MKEYEPGTELFEQYIILKALPEGGYGKVYLADDREIGREVVIKHLRANMAGFPEAVRRFEREPRLTAQVQHPNIVTVYDVKKDPQSGDRFLILEYVKGGSLREHIEHEGMLSIIKATEIIRDVCKGLKKAHEEGIVHRDIKPGNILLTGAKTSPIAKLTDFGVARASRPSDTYKTPSGTHPGTPAYQSPEQIRGEEIDGRSDLYSLGIVLYEMVTGEIPFADDVIKGHLVETPQPPSYKRRDVPESVDKIVLRALSKEPERRYQTVDDMLSDLNGAIKEVKREAELAYYYDEGLKYMADGEWEKSIEQFQKVIALDPSYQDASSQLAETKRHLADFMTKEEVEIPLVEEKEAMPTSTRHHYEEGLKYLQDQEWQRAIDEFKLVMNEDPNYPDVILKLVEVLYGRAVEFQNNGKLVKAREIFSEITPHFSHYKDVRYRLSEIDKKITPPPHPSKKGMALGKIKTVGVLLLIALPVLFVVLANGNLLPVIPGPVPTETPEPTKMPTSLLTLLKPVQGTTFTAGEPIEFEWQWDGDQGVWFEVKMRSKDKNFETIRLRETRHFEVAPPLGDFGEYEWQIVVFQEGQKYVSEIWSFKCE